MSESMLIINTPENCGDCPFCIFTADEKNYIGYCNTSDDDYYCKALERFMEYDKVDGGLDILGKPVDCLLQVKMGVASDKLINVPLTEEDWNTLANGVKCITYSTSGGREVKFISLETIKAIRTDIIECQRITETYHADVYNKGLQQALYIIDYRLRNSLIDL